MEFTNTKIKIFFSLIFSQKILLLLVFLPFICNAQFNVFFKDTISSDTVIVSSVDSFVKAGDTGINCRVGFSIGTVKMSHFAHDKKGISCIVCHHKKNNDERIKQCAYCHKGVGGMETLHNKCGQCHKTRAMDMSCIRCHGAGVKFLDAELSKIKFSHINHYSRKKDCNFCHTEPQKQTWLKGGNYPPMKTCLTCHNNKKASGNCSVCHNDVNTLKPKSHNYKWTQRYGHGRIANYDKAECMLCHSQRECDRCHLGQTSFKIHPAGYKFTHGNDVKMGLVNCALCHQTRNSCSQCHENRLKIK